MYVLAKVVRQQKYMRAKFGGGEDEMLDDDDEEDEEEEEKLIWGGRRPKFHGGDNRDFEVMTCSYKCLLPFFNPFHFCMCKN